jgi:DNA-binding transcriptional regulator YdaS (Cro superfamily)
MTPEKALQHAMAIVGGPAEMARQIGGDVTRQAVGQWKVCPPTRVLDVVAAVERAKARLKTAPTKHDLRPDIYPPPRR